MLADAGYPVPTRRRIMKRLRVLVPAVAAFALVSSACAAHDSQGSDGTSKVAKLSSVSELQDRFNADAGAVRLILLMSPT